MMPHVGGPRDFLDDNDIVVDGFSRQESVSSTPEETQACKDNFIGIKTASRELQATELMCYYCFDILIHELQKKTHHGAIPNVNPIFADSLPNRSIECPLFVTWEKQSRHIRSNSSRQNYAAAEASYELRGCIGSLTPKMLVRHLREYAIYSSFQDHRFNPITLEEVSQLRVSVSLLIQYETCQDCYDWTVGIHGIIIKFHPPKGDASAPSAKHRSTSSTEGGELSATFLPEVSTQQNWDQKKTVHQLIRKAGYKGAITDSVIQSIQCTRYQSSKCKVAFQEYVTQHLGLQLTTDDDGNHSSSKQFIRKIIEGNVARNPTKHNNDGTTHNCSIM